MSRLKKPFRIEIQKSAVVSSYKAIYVNVSELSAKTMGLHFLAKRSVVVFLVVLKLLFIHYVIWSCFNKSLNTSWGSYMHGSVPLDMLIYFKSAWYHCMGSFPRKGT